MGVPARRAHSGRISDEHALILEILKKAGLQFKYIDGSREALLLALLQLSIWSAVAGALGDATTKLQVGTASSFGSLGVFFMRRMAMELPVRLRYARDTVWDFYEERPKLTDAIDDAVEQWRSTS